MWAYASKHPSRTGQHNHGGWDAFVEFGVLVEVRDERARDFVRGVWREFESRFRIAQFVHTDLNLQNYEYTCNSNSNCK